MSGRRPGDPRAHAADAVQKRELHSLQPEVLAGGVERRRLTGDSLELIHYRYPPGARFAMHSHEAEQLTIVMSGELVFVFEDGEVQLRAGEALVIPGGMPHGAFVPDGPEATITHNVFTPVRERLPGGG